MEQELAANLKACASAYASARGYELSTLGRIACGDSGFFTRLDDPTKTFTARKYDDVIAWFSDHWPEGVRWPKGVKRPERSPAEAAPS